MRVETGEGRGRAERQRLLEEARKESESLRAKLQETLRNERNSLNREITTRTQREVLAIARTALSDLATTSLEKQMAQVFIRRLHELNGEEKRRLTSFLRPRRIARWCGVRSSCRPSSAPQSNMLCRRSSP